MHDIVFLFDFDNALLDGDHAQGEHVAHLKDELRRSGRPAGHIQA